MSQWPAAKARRVLAALLRIGCELSASLVPIAAYPGPVGLTTLSPFTMMPKSAPQSRAHGGTNRP